MKTITITLQLQEVMQALKKGGAQAGLELKQDLDLDQLQQEIQDDLQSYLSVRLEEFFAEGIINEDLYLDFFEQKD